MAQYWVYLNNEVAGPFGVEQLIRLRGFSRQTMVCVDDASGKPTHWISVAEIPELAHIFKAAYEQQAPPMQAASTPKPPAAHPATKAAGPAVVLRRPPRDASATWLAWLLGAVLAATAYWAWSQITRRNAQAQEQQSARALVENAHFPSSSQYATLGQYLQEKSLQPRWEFERLQDALYRVTLSWYAREGSLVYAFETNVQAQTVRGINTAGIRLLSEGFPAPASPKPQPVPPKKKSPAELFGQALDQYRQAVEGGDFQAVWDNFSARKKTEMAKAGMSRDGFIRLQTLTFKVDSPAKQTVLKSKQESETEMLTLIKQSQPKRPDIFVKQFWVFENGDWKLDDEQKRAATPLVVPAVPASSSTTPAAPAPKPSPASLPGMSN
jgi:hypothetical protein